jgi:hypothetical protein
VCQRIWHKIYTTGRGAGPCPDPRHSANPDPYPTRRLQGAHTPGLLRSSTSAAPEPSAPCPGGTHVIGQRVQVGLR